MKPARVFWIMQADKPPAYDGVWSPIRDDSSGYLSVLVRIRSGRPYILEGIPADTIPLSCEGSFPSGFPYGTWGVPAIYTKVTEFCWKGLTSGCQHRVELGSLLCTSMFAFTYEGSGSRLHVRYSGVSYPLAHRLCSWAEIDMIQTWGR